MTDFDLVLQDVRIATMCAGGPAFGIIDDGALAITGGTIAWLGPRTELPAHTAAAVRSLDGRWLSPALIDCHTHLVFGGNRAAEYEQRLAGASYVDIAKGGGGIMATVRATREASAEALLAAALPRARALLRDGVATLEIKSGYGLDLASETKMLEVARRIGDHTGQAICTTLLAAHAVPEEYAQNADGYIDLVCDQILPAVAARGLADAVDAYCESIAFDVEQIARVFTRAGKLGLRVKLHADQLSDGNGAALAARFDALSADHLEYSSAEGIAAMGAAGTVAVLLPGAYVTLKETTPPPLAALRANKVALALATDCNPGTSPLLSVREAMALASRVFALTPEEALAGATRNAARALGLDDDRGTLEVGKRADIAVWEIDHPRDLSYWLGAQPLSNLLIAGTDASLS